MSTTTSERRLVDIEFKPDELPAADAMPIPRPSQEAAAPAPARSLLRTDMPLLLKLF